MRSADVRSPRVLPADARYVTLSRPDYEPHPYGVRPGAACALAVAGGLLLAVAPFGAWYRVTTLTSAGAVPEVTRERLGWDIGGVPLLLVLGIAAVVLGTRWQRPSRARHLATSVVALGGAACAVALLVRLQYLIDDGVAAAVADPSFADRNAGAGWGAWSAGMGAAALVLAAALAALARVERRPGNPMPATDPEVRDDATS